MFSSPTLCKFKFQHNFASNSPKINFRNEDVTQTMYAAMYASEKKVYKKNLQKVDQICQKLLEAMNSSKDTYILPIISCHVKNSQSSVDNALLEIKNLKEAKRDNQAESALNFLLLLVQVNELFDVALGLYDFDLVLFVAEKSQKDPKEYLPFMNELKNIDSEDYKKYKIDMHLKRYCSALKNIAKCGPEHLEECIELVKNQRLYLDAMKLFSQGTEAHTKICLAYGDYLVTKKYYEDAALVYASGNLLVEAVSSWEQSGNWSFCLSLAKSAIKVPNEFSALCRRVVDKLKESCRYKEAAQVLADYLSDPEEAIVALIEGSLWSESDHLIHLHNRLDLYETNLKPAILSAAEETSENLDKKLESFRNYLHRFGTVVDMKEKLAEGNFDETDINVEDADLYSDMTSQVGSVTSKIKSNPGSLKTRASNRTKVKNLLPMPNRIWKISNYLFISVKSS